MHLMDVHDHRAINNFLNLLKDLGFSNGFERLKGNIKHRFFTQVLQWILMKI